jgi:hypothetical protein
VKLLDDDQALCRFTEVLLQQIDNDDEPWEDKGRQILLAALNDDKADDFLIALLQIPFDMRSVIPAICGHSFFKYFYGCKVNVLIRHLGQ